MSILKKKIGSRKGLWADELPEILWAYRTIAKTSTGQTPFALAYGIEAMAPVEVRLPSYRRRNFDLETNVAGLEESLDLLKEIRADAEVRVAAFKKKVEQYFNKRVRPRSFKAGDLVLKETCVTTGEEGKLGPLWEEPYAVVASHWPGTYQL
ncbi:uncharacterized protein LOC121255115 [Juglans microcarpa x Juglans regia]|uniref:uncharacterized protein LOC121255115 n=1 Tax=Juglans microcarpa x Juglans regia TaxID=2249226 RepID=UPI001B7F2A07|nr:uncharacterized protein LOC121255115 [Juglans microcarpa x Juglans regia]